MIIFWAFSRSTPFGTCHKPCRVPGVSLGTTHLIGSGPPGPCQIGQAS
jgi:hypothetical protein